MFSPCTSFHCFSLVLTTYFPSPFHLFFAFSSTIELHFLSLPVQLHFPSSTLHLHFPNSTLQFPFLHLLSIFIFLHLLFPFLFLILLFNLFFSIYSWTAFPYLLDFISLHLLFTFTFYPIQSSPFHPSVSLPFKVKSRPPCRLAVRFPPGVTNGCCVWPSCWCWPTGDRWVGRYGGLEGKMGEGGKDGLAPFRL